MNKKKSKEKDNDMANVPSGEEEFKKVVECFYKEYNLKPGQDFKVVLKPIKKPNTDKKS